MLTIFLAAALAQPHDRTSGASPGPDSVATSPVQIAGSISDADYPADAIRQSAQGTTAVRLTIGTGGEVSRCQIEQSSGHASLDAASCELITSRFRFKPGRTASGKPTRSTLVRRISWRLPNDGSATFADALPPMNFAPGLLRVTFGGTASERPRCAAEASGEAFLPHMPFQCFGFEQVAIGEVANAPVRIVTILRLQPEGAAPPAASSVRGGTLVSASSALIEVDPQGRIMKCTPVAVPDPGVAGSGQPHLCDGMYPGMPVFASPGGAANRKAAYQLEVYQTGVQPSPAA